MTIEHVSNRQPAYEVAAVIVPVVIMKDVTDAFTNKQMTAVVGGAGDDHHYTVEDGNHYHIVGNT